MPCRPRPAVAHTLKRRALCTVALRHFPGRSARPAPPPERYRHGDAQWCAPYAYKGRQDLGCGGADKWRIIPGSAFPLERWEEGSGSIYWWGCCCAGRRGAGL